MGIFSLLDLYKYLPKNYEDRSKKVDVINAVPDIKQYFELNIIEISKTYFYGKNKSVSRAKAKDETGFINLIWYNDRFTPRKIVVNKTYKFFGKYDQEKNALINPLVDSLSDDNIGSIVPIYKTIKGISNKELSKFKEYLFTSEFIIDEYLDKEILSKYRIQEINTMYKNLHNPKDNLSLYDSIYSYYFRNILLEKIVSKMYRDELNKKSLTYKIHDVNILKDYLDFDLTKSQELAIKDIFADMGSKNRMNRLVIGDVGSGKTLVAIFAAYQAILNSYQVAFMAPTEILAQQHYDKHKDLFNKLGIKSAILTGSTSTKDKKIIYEKIKNSEIDIIFGTHALYQDKIIYRNLGLVVVDEQQRFGVNQRKAIIDKGESPEILLLSATPIPRTLALALYDDLSLTYMDTMPSNRLEIKSAYMTIYQEKKFIDFAYKQILEGRQVYLVVSRVEDTDDLESVHLMKKKLDKYFNKKIKIECLYGELDSEKKIDIQNRFANGQIDMLIATSIVEVGIDVPNANTMIIYNANQFGLSQLHQLRGRVGRSDIQSYCFFVSSEKIKNDEKLDFISKNNDGFKIANKDLEMRGRGDLYGRNQSGFIYIDNSLLYNEQLLADVNKLINEDLKINSSLEKIINEELYKYKDIIMNWGNMALRVISGLRKGHKLRGPIDSRARPTEDRIKESLFNIIQPIEEEAVCLDLFAATGNIGIEFLSRGAKKVYFSEKDRSNVNDLKWNLDHTKLADKAEILEFDYKKNILTIRENIDYVYIDPPYESDYYIEALKLMVDRKYFKDALFILESNNDYDYSKDIKELNLVYEKKYGKKCLKFYRMEVWR